MFLKFLVKQLRHLVFFGTIWLLHLGIQKKLVRPHVEYAAPICHPYDDTDREGGESAEDSSQVDL